jgi:membrane protein DedA with SNARE-associated domain
MELWLAQLAGKGPYVVIFGVLLATGFGLPLPEDLPLLLAGYLAGTGAANPWIMFPGCFICIVGSDVIVYAIGRKYGHHVPKLPLLRRFLTEKRLAKTEAMLHTHGGKFIFMARFLPGLRMASFFTAGTFKIAFWRFLLYDGSAALISVPAIMGLAYVFADEIDRVREWVHGGQIVAVVVVVLAIGAFIAAKLWWGRRSERATG